MLSVLDLRGFTGELGARLPRPTIAGDPPVDAVRAILGDVKARGDAALRELTERFDGVVLDQLRVPSDELRAAREGVPAPLRDALERAAEGIADFHASELRSEATYERDGIVVRTIPVPVDRAGCYVPGGRAIYPSTVLMTAIPARVAGVQSIALCVPPDRATGKVPQATLAAAAIAEVDEVYAIGGAQASRRWRTAPRRSRRSTSSSGRGTSHRDGELEPRAVSSASSAFAGPSEVVVATTPPRSRARSTSGAG
jgi:histidinol dehydrogenase